MECVREVAFDLARAEPQDADAKEIREGLFAMAVGDLAIRMPVDGAIDFNNEFVTASEEVDDERAQWMLSPKLDAAKLPIANRSP